MDRHDLPGDALSIGALLALAIGISLRWVRVNPALPPDAAIPSIYLPGMAPGFDGFDFFILVPGALLLVLIVSDSWRRVRRLLGVIVGLVALLVAGLIADGLLVGDGWVSFGGTFVPALGWYVTVLGGVVLLVSGG